MAIRLGTCSWKFPSWDGIIYDTHSSRRYLAQYAQTYSTVEIDQWFWSLFGQGSIAMPRRETVAEYLADTPEHFEFSIKVPNSISLTHFYRKNRNDPLVENPHFLSRDLFLRFLELIEPLGERTVSLMLQFEYLNRRKMASPAQFNDRLGEFLLSLGSLREEWPLAVEPRNPQYLDTPYFEMLASHDVAHAFTHGYYMPSADSVYRDFAHLLDDRCVLRLLGPDRKGIEQQTGKKWNARMAPKDEELPAIADMITDLAQRGIDTTVNVNNHYEGSAPLTIGVLGDLLSRRGVQFR